MKHVTVILVCIALLSGVSYYVLNHPNQDEVERLSKELGRLEAKNRKLASENDKLQLEIEGLREDPRLAERRARETMGLARPDELILQFEQEEKVIPVAVTLEVHPQGKLTLAGKDTDIERLELALQRLLEQVPGAVLTVSFEHEVDAIAKQRVLDTVKRSKLAPARIETQKPKPPKEG